MFNWMSKRGKNAWALMIFLLSMFMPTVIPGVHIMVELDKILGHPWGVLGFAYLAISFFGIYYLWDRFYFKTKEKSKSKGEIEDDRNNRK